MFRSKHATIMPSFVPMSGMFLYSFWQDQRVNGFKVRIQQPIRDTSGVHWGVMHGKRSSRYAENTDLKKLCFRGIHIHFVSPGDLKSKVLLEICRSIPYGSTRLWPDLFLIWPLFFRSRIYCPPHVFKRLVFSLSWMKKMQSSFRFCLVDACMEIPTQVLGHLVVFYATTNKDIPE